MRRSSCTVRGLGYSQEAYNAARARLERKYGGSWRQVQSHLEEFKKLKPLQKENAKALEIFADVLEWAVICLKENGRQADLEAGTLYTIVLEKIPEKLLSQNYRWLREKQNEESMETLKDWFSQEAEYQIPASEMKHGFRKIQAETVNGNGSGQGGRTFYGKSVGVPVIVKNGNKRIPVNCLLDEGSDMSYINEDVIEALGLHGAKTEINGKVANDETVTFMSSTFDVGLQSTDGHVDTTITVQSSKKICGADHHELMCSMKEVVGEHGQPSARPCLLRWTAVGKVNGTESNGSHHTGFHHTYFLNQNKPSISCSSNR
ncbi:Hypothetical predicted protein [Paramuricea clavata]|uniref:Uncharacterized protein n=1 Tax=Paramuricea clavata TaxID=317549 RepID=A0A6S7HYA8_PARCT|nr:Hypothetical predicted protein [Paramuricea clavata]